VRHRSGGSQAQSAGGLDVARRDEPHHRGRACDGHGGLDPVCSSHGEVHEVPIAGGQPVARGLRGERRLGRDEVEQRRLDELSHRDRGRDLEDRLVRQHDGSLGNGPDVARESQRTERVDVVIAEAEFLAEVREILVPELEALEEVEGPFESGSDEEPSFPRQ
jgi:hypothetical protein